MIRIVTSLFLTTFLLNTNRSQELVISEFDLYGIWIMEANEEETDSIDFLFKKFDGDKTLTTKHWISLDFQAFNKCVFKTSVDSSYGFCSTQVPYDKPFIWNFNKEKEEIVIYKKLIEINTNQDLKSQEVMRLKVLSPNENQFLLDLVSWE